jgi:RNA polymerase sigma factor (sigma-70 family)
MVTTMDEFAADSLRTRASLLSRVKNLEDARSWEEFFRTYERLVHGLARRRGLNQQEAEDVAQEVFNRVARTIHQFQRAPHAGAFRSWLGRLTKWRADDQRRRGREALPLHHSSHDGEPGTSTLERVPAPDTEWQEFETEARKHLLESLFRQLEQQRVPPKHLQIFQLIVVDGVPATRVAQMFELSTTHVYVIKHRIMQKLRDEVQRLPVQW